MIKNCLFCWMEALSVCSDHYRAMGFRTRGGGGAVALGEMDVAGLNPYRFVQGQPLTPSALGLLPTRPANGVHRTPGGGIQSRSATYLVGDDHQARIT